MQIDDRAGHDIVHIDDDYSNAPAAGLPAISHPDALVSDTPQKEP